MSLCLVIWRLCLSASSILLRNSFPRSYCVAPNLSLIPIGKRWQNSANCTLEWSCVGFFLQRPLGGSRRRFKGWTDASGISSLRPCTLSTLEQKRSALCQRRSVLSFWVATKTHCEHNLLAVFVVLVVLLLAPCTSTMDQSLAFLVVEGHHQAAPNPGLLVLMLLITIRRYEQKWELLHHRRTHQQQWWLRLVSGLVSTGIY
jgi:hypothetical protein